MVSSNNAKIWSAERVDFIHRQRSFWACLRNVRPLYCLACQQLHSVSMHFPSRISSGVIST